MSASQKTSQFHCLVTESKGKLRYHHQILQAVIVHPDMRQVIPLAPEQVSLAYILDPPELMPP